MFWSEIVSSQGEVSENYDASVKGEGGEETNFEASGAIEGQSLILVP